MDNLLEMIDDYLKHIEYTTQNRSLLARIYGVFTVKACNMSPINLIIMENTAILRNTAL